MRTFAKFLAAAALISACGGTAPAQFGNDEQFVSVSKDTAAPAANPADESFYLAINKSELGKKYFLSAYLTQYFPGAVGYGAARSMGTRVVTFRVQNGKLIVFDAANYTHILRTRKCLVGTAVWIQAGEHQFSHRVTG